MKRVKGKTIIYIVLSIIVFVFIFFMIQTFSYSTPKFQNYCSVSTDNSGYFLDNEDILFSSFDDATNQLKVKKITGNEKVVNTITSVTVDEQVDNYYLTSTKDYYYLSYNNAKKIYQIKKDNLETEVLVNSNDDVIVYSNYDIYAYSNNKLTSLKDDSVLNINLSIKNIKNIEFYAEKMAFIYTYDGKMYSYDFISNLFYEFDKIVNSYCISDAALYFAYTNENKIGIGVVNFNNQDPITFEISNLAYDVMKTDDKYLYLISEHEIYKINLETKKQNETLKIDTYNEMNYQLRNVMIVNESLMYLPMIKIEDNSQHIYRYKR